MSLPAEVSPAPRRRHGRFERKELIGLALIVAGILAFAQLAAEVHRGRTQAFDESVLESLRDPNNNALLRGPKWVPETARDITALGGYTVLSMVLVLVCCFLALVGNHVAWRFISVATVSGWMASVLLKKLFERPRPSIVPGLSAKFSSSFPSGHSMMSAVVYLTMGALLARFAPGRAIRVYCLGVAITLSFLIGCSRVMMGVHYPTDVIGGWIAGGVWATLCWLIARRWQKKHPEDRPPDMAMPADSDGT